MSQGNTIKNPKLRKMIGSKEASDSRSFMLNIICGIMSREFDKSRFKNNTMIRIQKAAGEGGHGDNSGKRVPQTSGTRRDSGNTCVSTKIGRTRFVWDELGLLDVAIKETRRYLGKRERD